VTGAAATSFPIFAAATAAKEPLIVSIHDVAPATRGTCEQIIRELTRIGATPCSLLVVPNYHGAGESCGDRQFVRWLRDLEAQGHEVVIHGYFHQRPRGGRETLRAKLLTRYYTRGEGEFYDLSYTEAFERITRAREQFNAAGLKPRGFIAPAWLLGAEAERAAADAEMEYTTRLTAVHDLRTSETFHSRSLVYSVRNGWRRRASLAWNGALSVVLAASPLMRLGIHPPDFRHRPIWNQITRVAERLADVRSTTTYCDWIADARLRRGGL
jgi:predicted deacetylase